MTTVQSKNPIASQKAPPIDLNKLHTPYKLAQFVVGVPKVKQDYSFLFNEENKLNSTTNTQSQSFINKGLNLHPNHSHLLNINSINSMQSSMIHKTKSKSSFKKKRSKKKSKTRKFKLSQQNKHLTKDEQDNINDPYNPINNDIGPSNNILPNASPASSKTNVFPNNKSKQKRPRQHDLMDAPPSTIGIGTIGSINNIKPTLPSNNISDGISSPVSLTQMAHSELNNTTDSLQSHHHKSQLSTSSVHSTLDTNILNPNPLGIPSIPEPEPFDEIPQPTVPVIPSKYDEALINDSSMMLPSEETFKYEISMIDTPTIDDKNIQSIFGINDVKLGDGPPNIEEQFSQVTTSEEEEEEEQLSSSDSDSSYSESGSVSGSDSEQSVSGVIDEKEMEEFGFISSARRKEEEEENICILIGKVLYENSWTGDMISSSTEFSRREYNALLNVGNISTDSYMSNLVWKIIFYSQKKTKDELINEDKIHIKWYWYDCNDIESDWKWRKYNVIICQWITNCYEKYLNENNKNEKQNWIINFQECQQQFEKDHEKSEKKNNNNNKREEMKGGDSDSDEKINNNNKKKRITIDPYFDKKNTNYNHFLVIEKDENDIENILIWHKIANKSNDGLEYYREIRLNHKLFDIKPDMIVPNYQPNPSPFAIPPQLAVDT